MDISLVKAEVKNAQTIYDIQRKAFLPLLEKYQDFDTSPANEPIEKTIDRLNQQSTDFYLIMYNGNAVGGIRVLKKGGNRCSIGPLFILPCYQGKGLAQKTFRQIEDRYTDIAIWELETILQEPGNCHLYEKMGYHRTGKLEFVNKTLTLVFYEKHIK